MCTQPAPKASPAIAKKSGSLPDRFCSCNCLFFVLINNLENQTYAMELDNLKDRISACSKLNWTYWKYNDAAEIAKMLDI
jgi:hypothetical protein